MFKKLGLLSTLIVGSLSAQTFAACVGCSRLEALESSMTYILGLQGYPTDFVHNSPDQQAAQFNITSGTVQGALKIGSMTAVGTITSATGFVGNGAGIYGVPFSQSLPLPQFSTYYALWTDVKNSTGSIGSLLSAISPSSGTIVASSATFFGTVTSSTGFVGGGSSMTTVNAGRFIGDGSLLTNVPSSGGGGGYPQAPYRLIIGTCSTYGANVIGTDEKVFAAAVASATNLGVSDIYVQEGNYTVKGASIPYGLTFTFASSASIHDAGTNQVFIVSGTINGGNMVSNAKFSGCFIECLDHARINDVVFGRTGWTNTHGARAGIIRIIGAKDVRIINTEFRRLIKDNGGQFVLFSLYGSTEVTINGVRVDNTEYLTNIGGEDAGFYFTACESLTITNVRARWYAGRFLYINTGIGTGNITNLKFDKNYIEFDSGVADSNGNMFIYNQTASVVLSSGISISGNTFRTVAMKTGGHPILAFYSAGAGTIEGASIDNNLIFSTGAVTRNFVTISDVNTKRTVLKDNNVTGISGFLSDAGTATKFTTLSNFLNGVEQ